MSLLGFGSRSLIPDELMDGFGYDLASDTWMIRPGIPLVGRVERNAFYPSPAAIAIFLFSAFDDQLRKQWNRTLVWQAAIDAILTGIGRVDQDDFPNPLFEFRWRAAGGSGAWTTIPGNYLGVSLNTGDASEVIADNRFVKVLGIEDRRVDPTDAQYDAGIPALPTEGQYIEFFLVGPIPPDEQHPIILDGLTDGELTANVYAGVYSERDENGAVVATGIRYVEGDVLAMPNPVRMVLPKPIDDGRDWLEKVIYGANGYCPRLDDLGRISPVFQAPPTDLTGLYTLDNTNTIPAPDWDGGQRVINHIRFKYRRYHPTLIHDPDTGDLVPGAPDPPPKFRGQTRQAHLQWVEIEWNTPQDDDSIRRFGLQTLEIDGSAYGALGRVPDEETVQPTRSRVVGRRPNDPRPRVDGTVPGSVHVEPISGFFEDETGYQLFLDRVQYVLERYRMGAPTMRLIVQRQTVPDLRVGHWVLLNLSWFPDYITQRRGLVGLAQVVSLGDKDCEHIQVTVEQVLPGDVS